MKTVMILVSELVLDFALYPRADVDSQHVRYLREAMEAGATVPPIVVDKKSKRVIDGFHRVRAKKMHAGDDAKIECIEREYPSDKEMFLDAMRLNAGHGRRLTPFDQTHCLTRAETLGIEMDAVASALTITTAAMGKLSTGRVGTLASIGRKGKDERVPIKRTILHKAGQRLTREQYEVNDKLGGMNQLFYVNQLIMLIESDLLDTENEALMEGLGKLRGLLETATAVTA